MLRFKSFTGAKFLFTKSSCSVKITKIKHAPVSGWLPACLRQQAGSTVLIKQKHFMYYVYILKSSNYDWHYVGLSQHPEERLHEHNSGRVRSTKSRRPYSIIYNEAVQTLAEARKLEKKLKNGFAKKRIVNSLQ